MNALNICFLAQMEDEVYFSEYETALSRSMEMHVVKIHEQQSLRALVRRMEECSLPLDAFDGFFLSFVISHISKEFDLLKIAQDRSRILNIELKSQDIGPYRIRKQLMQNRYYLRHICPEIYSYTYVLSTDTLYHLQEDGRLEVCTFQRLAQDVISFRNYVAEGIDRLFSADDFLISPASTPDKFLSGGYFLTTQQNDFKAQILEKIDPCLTGPGRPGGLFLCLTGNPGTGKTLLLYDLAADLGKRANITLLHGSKLREGHRYLNEHMEGVTICSASEADLQDKPRLVLVDEAPLLTSAQFEQIQAYVRAAGAACIFSFDSRQGVYAPGESRQIALRIQSISDATLRLSDKIRSNKELSSFITTLFDLKKRARIYSYEPVEIIYAPNAAQARRFTRYFMDKGYASILYSDKFAQPEALQSGDSPVSIGNIESTGCEYRSSDVAGLEFNCVVMVLDGRFYYNQDGKLCSRTQPEEGGDGRGSLTQPTAKDDTPLTPAAEPAGETHLYRELLFQGVSRARERLALIVCGQPRLFEQINAIKLGRRLVPSETGGANTNT